MPLCCWRTSSRPKPKRSRSAGAAHTRASARRWLRARRPERPLADGRASEQRAGSRARARGLRAARVQRGEGADRGPEADRLVARAGHEASVRVVDSAHVLWNRAPPFRRLRGNTLGGGTAAHARQSASRGGTCSCPRSSARSFQGPVAAIAPSCFLESAERSPPYRSWRQRVQSLSRCPFFVRASNEPPQKDGSLLARTNIGTLAWTRAGSRCRRSWCLTSTTVAGTPRFRKRACAFDPRYRHSWQKLPSQHTVKNSRTHFHTQMYQLRGGSAPFTYCAEENTCATQRGEKVALCTDVAAV